jgi:tripartite-type tricarboxylate transporter receptor subunit TctC
LLHDVIKKSLENPVYVKYIKDNHLDVRPGYLGPEATRKYWEQQIEFFTDSLKELGYLK